MKTLLTLILVFTFSLNITAKKTTFGYWAVFGSHQTVKVLKTADIDVVQSAFDLRNCKVNIKCELKSSHFYHVRNCRLDYYVEVRTIKYNKHNKPRFKRLTKKQIKEYEKFIQSRED